MIGRLTIVAVKSALANQARSEVFFLLLKVKGIVANDISFFI